MIINSGTTNVHPNDEIIEQARMVQELHDRDRIEMERVDHESQNLAERFIQNAERMAQDHAAALQQHELQQGMMSPVHRLVTEKTSISNLLEPKHE